MSSCNIMAIDIGMKGGYCIYGNDKDKKASIIEIGKMPTIVNEKRHKRRFNKFIDKEKLYNTISNAIVSYNVDTIVMEDIQNIYGVSKHTMFSLGRQVGLIEGIVEHFTDIDTRNNVLTLELVTIRPKEWQRYMFSKIDKSNVSISSKIKSTKQYALEVFKQLYPEWLNKVKARKVYHDGIIDAVLLAAYYWEIYKDSN